MNLLTTLLRKPKFLGLAAIVIALGLAVAVPTALRAAQPRDCDTNAIMNCGAYTIGEWTTKYNAATDANIQSIYTGFGVNATTFQNVVDGTVTKSGDVIVNGQVVATNVWTAGRHDIGNSVPMNGVYMRPPAVSFLSDSLDAFVNMDGGHFNYAVIKSCGNPVFSISKPFGQIFKRVADNNVDATKFYAADDAAHAVTVTEGDTLTYQVEVTNNGTADMTNVNFTDNLPAGVELVSNATKRNIAAQLRDIKANGDFVVSTITVKVTANSGTITNQACFTADQNQTGCDTAVITVVPKSTPTPTPSVTPTPSTTPTPTPTPSSFACGSLVATQQGNSDSLTYQLKVNSQLTNIPASAVTYTFDFGDGSTLHTNNATVTHTYAKAGDYRATVTVITPNGSTTLTPDCMLQFHVGPPICQTNPQANGCGGETPPTTPRTGAEGLAGLGGLSAIGYGVREYVRSKKSLLEALKK